MHVLGIQEMGIPEAIIHAINQLPVGRCFTVLAEAGVFIAPSRDSCLNYFLEGGNIQIHFGQRLIYDT